MAEYRMGELALASGVTSRNIRAYRERGLLDPPRRAGKIAIYDDHHLAQLRTINQLLRKGFTSAHIAAFFDKVRSGHDLADYLGLGPHVLGTRSVTQHGQPVDIDPHGPDATRLLDVGLARRAGASLMWANPAIGAVAARTGDQRLYVRAILQLFDIVGGDLQRLADVAAAALREIVLSSDHRASYRELIVERFDRLLAERLQA